MQITYYGHSCFLLTADNGVKLLTDPCDGSTGYDLNDIPADILTISHAHFDHNYIQAAAGTPVILETRGAHEVKGIRISGYQTWHDDVKGAKRGQNIVFLIEMDGLRICHLGDLGEMPDEAFYRRLGRVDVLLTPVGGTFTLDAEQATAVMDQIHPRITIPMHYRTPRLTFSVDDVTPFVALAGDRAVRMVSGSDLSFAQGLPSVEQIVVLTAKG